MNRILISFLAIFGILPLIAPASAQERLGRAALQNQRSSQSLDTSGAYIGVGVKGIFWGDKTLANDPAPAGGGAAADLKIEYDDALYYYFVWGSAWDSSFFRFRFDTEIYFGKNDVKLTRATNVAEGKITGYGLNLNAYYDLPTFFRFTPYIGASAMALGMELKFDDTAAARGLGSQRVDSYISASGTDERIEGFNLLYGYGFIGGLRWEIASALALDASYRVVRFSDCVTDRGCNLLLQKTTHEVRAALVLRF